ncbi:MAG: 50S ribosomal protein L5 [Bdellovibrionaceae bacterium]|nr:50S ribosomal protein L5 [Pseudobdellovibrionaceae bacterium]
MTTLEQQYRDEVIAQLKKQFNHNSVMAVPKIEKIVLNTSTGEAVKNPKLLNTAVDELTAIAGQKAVLTRARNAISNFKLREGMPLGARVTLRRERMWAFLERLIHLTIPQVRDFRGLSPKGFDGRGNYNMGLKEQIVFPEIDYDKVDKIRGLNITIVTSAKDDAQGRALLEALGFPFKK